MRTEVEKKFSEFYEKWICQLEEYISETQNDHSNQPNYEALVAKLTTHHKDYYTAKWAAAREDVLAFFPPVWLSPLENAYIWITGWKPSTVFRLVESLRQNNNGASQSLAAMTDDQWKKIQDLRAKLRLEEEKVEREMERQQVAVADRQMVELVRMASRVKNGDLVVAHLDDLVQVALKSLLCGLERVMKMADCARLKTLKCTLAVLSPIQCLEFLAAISMLQIQLRKWGKKRENRCFENDICPTKSL